MTIQEIKKRTQITSPLYFSRNTMKFFGQTLKDFTVTEQPDGRFMMCAPIRADGRRISCHTVRFFNPKTNELELESTRKEQRP